MNARMLALFLLLSLSAGASTPPTPVVTAPSLEGDSRLPSGEIESLCSPEQWKVLKALQYRALVIFDIQVTTSGKMSLGTVRTSEPDDTWTKPARELAKQVRLKVSSAGTHIPVAAEIFVIFYGQGPDARRALIYARQRDNPLPGTFGRAKFIAIEKY